MEQAHIDAIDCKLYEHLLRDDLDLLTEICRGDSALYRLLSERYPQEANELTTILIEIPREK